MYGDAPHISPPVVLGETHRWQLYVKDRRTGCWFLRELAVDEEQASRLRHLYWAYEVVVVGPKREG